MPFVKQHNLNNTHDKKSIAYHEIRAHQGIRSIPRRMMSDETAPNVWSKKEEVSYFMKILFSYEFYNFMSKIALKLIKNVITVCRYSKPPRVAMCRLMCSKCPGGASPRPLGKTRQWQAEALKHAYIRSVEDQDRWGGGEVDHSSWTSWSRVLKWGANNSRELGKFMDAEDQLNWIRADLSRT